MSVASIMSTDAQLDFTFGKTVRQKNDEGDQWMPCSARVRRQLLELREFAAPRMIRTSAKISDTGHGPSIWCHTGVRCSRMEFLVGTPHLGPGALMEPPKIFRADVLLSSVLKEPITPGLEILLLPTNLPDAGDIPRGLVGDELATSTPSATG